MTTVTASGKRASVPTAVDESPSPLPTPSPSRSPFSLGFRTPDAPPSSPLPSPSPSPEDPESLDGSGPDSEGEWDAARFPESLDGTSSPTSPPASSGADAVEVLDSEALRDMGRAAVAIAGHQAHEHLARTDGQRQVGLFLTDEQDQAGIGDPLARIVGRHQGVGKMSKDTEDVLAALVSIARYGTKQVTAAKHAKSYDLAQGRDPQATPTDGPAQ